MLRSTAQTTELPAAPSAATGEINGKSSNLNHCLTRVIYPGFCPVTGAAAWQLIPRNEVVVVFDADMVAKTHFFTRILQVGGYLSGGHHDVG
jgi:hypothetical protein